MAFCKNCGSEMEDNAQFCPKCGSANNVQTVNYQQNGNAPAQENSVWGILAIVFGALGGMLGLIFAIVGLCVYKKGSPNRRNAWIGLGLFIAWIVIIVIYYVVVLSALGAMVATY